MRRSQIVSLLLAILIGFGSLAGVLAAGWTPGLGVQLQGGVEVLLRPTSPADDEQLDRAIEIIRSRVDALGVAERKRGRSKYGARKSAGLTTAATH